MKICIAQTRPVKGDIQSNIDRHQEIIEFAVANGSDTIIFPELSITGYEPQLAQELAIDLEDRRFDDFQKIADIDRVTIGVGVPTKNNAGICISMLIFQPHKQRQIYSKKYIHPDEEAFFISGQNSIKSIGDNSNIAIAICYELSVPEHSADAFKGGAEIYIASVAKSAIGVEKACESLSEIARKYSMTVLMSNCIGQCDDFESAGQTSVWNDRGLSIGQLNDTDEGIIIIDTDTQKVIGKYLI